METYVITGITGFLGRNLARHILKTTDARIIGISRRWDAQERLAKELNTPRISMFNGDIRDRVFKDSIVGHIPEQSIFFHTAAYKHVPLGNKNVHECVSVNVDGTRNMLWLADMTGAENFVFISTDKAVAPINVYGQAKAIAEQMVLNRLGKSVVCRFGNVWGSTGSVVEFWAKLIKKKNPVFYVTDPSMTRYWYPLSKAVEYVFDSSRMTNGVVIPLLKSSTMGNLAEACSALASGARVEYIGVRDGEKTHESMTTATELAQRHLDTGLVSYGRVVLRLLSDDVVMQTPFNADQIISSYLAPKYSVTELMEMMKYYEENELGRI